ncbi:MAG: helix-turn-helix domain-containing protein [Alcaligenaceae bacterium]|nr:MAG: helix-turn-helix domain-containing protein [Alcaligenaceae bacterium]
MERLTYSSTSTITRACHLAVGLPPMKRIKQIRMSMAQGLVRRSKLTMNEISQRVGYRRLNEFSRDYKTHFGLSPSQDK